MCIVNGHGEAIRGADVMVDADLNSPGASGNPWGGAAPSFEVVANSAQAAAGPGYAGPYPVGQKIPVQTRNGAAYIEIRNISPSEALVLVNHP